MSDELSGRRKRINSVLGVLAGVGLNAIAVLLALRILGPTGRGQMVALTLVATMVYVFFGLGLPAANVYFAARDFEGVGALAGNALLMSFALPLVAGLVSLAIPIAWLKASGVDISIGHLRLAVVLSPAVFAFQQLAAVVQGRGDYVLLRNGRIIQGVVLIVGTAAAPLWFLPTPAILFCVWAAAYAAGAVFFLVAVGRSASLSLDLQRLAHSFRYGRRAMWTQVWEFVNMRGDQVLVAGIAPPAVLGLYATAVSLSEVLLHVPNAVSQVVFSDTAAGLHADQHSRVIREAGVVFALTLAGGVALVAVTWLIVVPLTGLSAGELVPPLALMVVPLAAFASARLLGAFLMGGGRPELPGLAAAVSFVVTIALDIVFVPRAGALGASAGVSAGYLAAAVVMVLTFVARGRAVASDTAMESAVDDPERTELPT